MLDRASILSVKWKQSKEVGSVQTPVLQLEFLDTASLEGSLLLLAIVGMV